MKKLTIKEKLDIVRNVKDNLNEGRMNFLCNMIYEEDHPSNKYRSDDDRDEFLQLNFKEFFEYKPKELAVWDDTGAWFDSERITERLLIVNDLIYRYEQCLSQKKAFNKIKSKYVALPYKY